MTQTVNILKFVFLLKPTCERKFTQFAQLSRFTEVKGRGHFSLCVALQMNRERENGEKVGFNLLKQSYLTYKPLKSKSERIITV